ncbi:MAG: hypothetical protein AB7P23_07890 [Amphiplicatus sp.]
MAAQLVTASWIASVMIWRWADPDWRCHSLAGVDLLLAAAFFTMARRRYFPAPLYFLHGALVVYYIYAVYIGSPIIWVAGFVNRVFELEVIYIAGCAAYRIARRSQRENGARERLAPPLLKEREQGPIRRRVSPSDDEAAFSKPLGDRRRMR